MIPFFSLYLLARMAHRGANATVTHRNMPSVHRPTLKPQRNGKWKNQITPLDLVMYVTPRDWNHERHDGHNAVLVGPPHASGWSALVAVSVVDGPHDAQKLYDLLIKRSQEREKFQLIDGNVVEREGGLQAAAIRYTYEDRLVSIQVRELVFTVGHRSVVWMRSLCPMDLLNVYGEAIDVVFGSLRSAPKAGAQRLSNRPNIKPQLD